MSQAGIPQSTLLTYMRQLARGQAPVAAFWTIGLSIYAGLIVLIYPSVRDSVNLDAIPANLRAAFNIDDFTRLASFLSSQLLGVILPLILPFFGIILLSDIVAGAEERGRLDLLLGNPIPRRHLVLGAFTVTAGYLLGIVIVIGFVIWAVAQLQSLDLALERALRASWTLWPASLFFGALALAMSTVVRRRSLALGIPAATVFLMYLLNVIGRLAPDVGAVRYASAYHYYGTAITEGIWWTGMAVLVAGAAALVGVAVIAFDRRDIYA